MRKIIDQQDFVNVLDKTSETLTVTVCGPSDSPKASHPTEAVVIFEWRSPMGEDLRVEIPRADLINFISMDA